MKTNVYTYDSSDRTFQVLHYINSFASRARVYTYKNTR